MTPTHIPPVYVILTKTTDLGTIKDHRITTGYRVEGWATMMPTVNHCFSFLRTVAHDGADRLGVMTTSPVQSVVVDEATPDVVAFKTRNSTYCLTLDRSRAYDAAALPAPAIIVGLDTGC